ncbi:MAG: hypothetical protein KUG75_01170 [Pseudomonadales bacterium]|nr:hypothetical protein [Pseudomonadales bacterium]
MSSCCLMMFAASEVSAGREIPDRTSRLSFYFSQQKTETLQVLVQENITTTETSPTVPVESPTAEIESPPLILDQYEDVPTLSSLFFYQSGGLYPNAIEPIQQPEPEGNAAVETVPATEVTLNEEVPPPLMEDTAMPLIQTEEAIVVTTPNVNVESQEEPIIPVILQNVIEPLPANTTLTISTPWTDAGSSATLSWDSTGVSECQASGSWSGSKSIAGSLTVGPITADSNFTLNCEGKNGSAVAMATIRVRSATLSWARPTQNADGSPLLDLASYQIYYGQQPGAYTQKLALNADVTQVTVNLIPGKYYFSISSIDNSNNESKLSQEVSKLIQ